MADLNPTTNILDDQTGKKKLPDMLNVLSWLSFIGCGLGLISAIWSFVGAKKAYDTQVEMQSKLEDAPAVVKRMMGPDPVAMALKILENRTPILLLSLVSIGLCFYGVLEMRKRKKAGFSIYLIGEILPIITTFIFIGIGLLSTFTLTMTFLFPILFIILYATQLKHLS